jgi:hypothetical protein
LGKDTTKRKLYNHFLHEYRHKKIQWNTCKLNWTTH